MKKSTLNIFKTAKWCCACFFVNFEQCEKWIKFFVNFEHKIRQLAKKERFYECSPETKHIFPRIGKETKKFTPIHSEREKNDIPAGIYLAKVNNRNTRTRCEYVITGWVLIGCGCFTVNFGPTFRGLFRTNSKLHAFFAKDVNHFDKKTRLRLGSKYTSVVLHVKCMFKIRK